MKHIKAKWIAKGIVFGLLAVSAITFLTMLLWNNLATELFGLPVIGFFQALGLMVLGRLLTGGFGPRGWRGSPGRSHFLRERWKNMSEEERLKFRQRWGKYGCEPDLTEPQSPETPEAA